MRAYVSARAGINVRTEPNIKGKIAKKMAYGSPIDVDAVRKGFWSRLLNTQVPLYALGDNLTIYPIENFVSPISYSKLNLHASAGGWAPDDRQLRTVQDNHINAVLICTYAPQAANQISLFRSVGVEQFIIRAIAPSFPRDGAAWARMAVNRIQSFANELPPTFMLQLHNEPNLRDEGLYSGWNSGAEYSAWYLKALAVIKQAFPRCKVGFSPMSPGVAIPNRRIEEHNFVLACSAAIQASDWIAVHCYYGNADASDLAIPVNYWRTFAYNKPIICTEAGPSIGKLTTTVGASKMFADFAKVRIPAFGWILHSAGSADFRLQSWSEMGIVLPRFGS